MKYHQCLMNTNVTNNVDPKHDDDNDRADDTQW